MTATCYFHHATNQAFHDLTDGESLPAAAAFILGMGLKFIPTPKFTTSQEEVRATLIRLELDLGCKT